MGLHGALLRDLSRNPIGRVEDVLLDPDTREPRWLRVRLLDAAVGVVPETGEAPPEVVLVPASTASEIAPGEVLVPYEATTIAAAADDPATAVVTAASAARLRTLYGFEA